jgi:hypothetical protein
MPRFEWRSSNHEREEANVWLNGTDSVRQRWQREEPTGDGQRARCSRAPCRWFPLERHTSLIGEECHIVRKSVKVPVEALGWSLASGRGGPSELPTDQKQPEIGLVMTDRIIHHIPWEHLQ